MLENEDYVSYLDQTFIVSEDVAGQNMDSGLNPDIDEDEPVTDGNKQVLQPPFLT